LYDILEVFPLYLIYYALYIFYVNSICFKLKYILFIKLKCDLKCSSTKYRELIQATLIYVDFGKKSCIHHSRPLMPDVIHLMERAFREAITLPISWTKATWHLILNLQFLWYVAVQDPGFTTTPLSGQTLKQLATDANMSRSRFTRERIWNPQTILNCLIFWRGRHIFILTSIYT